MRACSSAAEWRAAIALFGRMERSDVHPDAIAIQEALESCAGGGYAQLALELLSRLQELVSDNTAKSQDAARRAKKPGRGRRVAINRRGSQRGGKPTTVNSDQIANAFDRAACACRRAGDLRQAERLEAEAELRRVTARTSRGVA